jgi:hypothetical protein
MRLTQVLIKHLHIFEQQKDKLMSSEIEFIFLIAYPLIG